MSNSEAKSCKTMRFSSKIFSANHIVDVDSDIAHEVPENSIGHAPVDESACNVPQVSINSMALDKQRKGLTTQLAFLDKKMKQISLQRQVVQDVDALPSVNDVGPKESSVSPIHYAVPSSPSPVVNNVFQPSSALHTICDDDMGSTQTKEAYVFVFVFAQGVSPISSNTTMEYQCFGRIHLLSEY